MTNEQLIKSRWQFTDKLLKQYQKDFKLIFNDIKDELVELFNELNIDRDSLNKTISSSIKRKLERNKKEWKEANIITPYFQFLIDTTTKLTNSNVLKLFVFAIYLKYQQKELNKSKKLFVEVANDIFNQAKQETNIEPEKEDLLWKNIRDWTIVQTINIPFDKYLGVLNQTASEESSRLFIDYINSDLILDDSGLSKLIEKQKNRLISINGEKYSGVLENISRQVGNRAYFEPFPNQLVKFVAEVDDKTTKMCLSMNDFIFNTKDRNVFYRYSAATNTKVKYEIDGLVEGINLPPIMDHFHWCRSTLTYQVQITSKEYNELLKYNEPIYFIKRYDLINLEKSKNPKILFSDNIIVNNKKYSNNDIVPNRNNGKEEENAKWLSETFDIDVTIMPEVKQTEINKNIKSYDYLLDSSLETWDLKANISSIKKNVFKNNINSKASSYIFDIQNCKYSNGKVISEDYVDEIVNYTFATERYLNTIIVKNDNKLIGVYYNK